MPLLLPLPLSSWPSSLDLRVKKHDASISQTPLPDISETDTIDGPSGITDDLVLTASHSPSASNGYSDSKSSSPVNSTTIKNPGPSSAHSFPPNAIRNIRRFRPSPPLRHDLAGKYTTKTGPSSSRSARPQISHRFDPKFHLDCLQCISAGVKCSFAAKRQRHPQWLGYTHCSRCVRTEQQVCAKQADFYLQDAEVRDREQREHEGNETAAQMASKEEEGHELYTLRRQEEREVLKEMTGQMWWMKGNRGSAMVQPLPWELKAERRLKVVRKVRGRWGYGGWVEGADEVEEVEEEGKEGGK